MEVRPLRSGHTLRFLSFLVAAVTYLKYPLEDPSNRVVDLPLDTLRREYDFIVVGAGTAGCVVSNRLTAVDNWTLLLLEAGPDEDVLTDVPLLTRDSLDTPYDWNYTSIVQPRACRGTGGRCTWPQGRGLGGSSLLSDNVYIRGNPRDYDSWAAAGNPGWTYSEILPYFRLSEDNETPEYRKDTKYHGKGGYMTVSRAPHRTPLSPAFLEAGSRMGYPRRDLNAASQTGFMESQVTLKNGSRCSSAKAFLRPICHRSNFNVSYNSHVLRVLVGRENKTAYGVVFTNGGRNYTVFARKEVIISAGSVNSVRVLWLSGIGPSRDLRRIGVEVVLDLPVGRRLLDHPSVPLVFKVNQSVTLTKDVYESPKAVMEYALEGRGPLTEPYSSEVVGFLHSPLSDRALDYPDIEFIMGSSIPDHSNNLQLWYLLVGVTRARSVGNVTLRNAGPFTPPVINPSYFSEPLDLEVLLHGLRLGYSTSRTPPLQAFGSSLHLGAYPHCRGSRPPSHAWWSCLATHYSSTMFHAQGTCKMGPSSDPEAVVDHTLRVHGSHNLRVVDSSIVPSVVNGNTNAPVMMIAERGSAWILSHYRQPSPLG